MAEPLPLRLVHGANVVEANALLAIPEVLQDVSEVTRELSFVTLLQIRRRTAGRAEGQAIAGHASRRAIDEGQELRHAARLRRAKKPALARLPRPVVLPFPGFKGFGRTPGMGDLRIDPPAYIEAPAGKPRSAFA